MDVENYIGLFLLKNHFCYVHGLGSLELKRKAGIYDGAMLHPAYYEVVITPVSSVDDTLANYIATNEQISISKASSELRDFTSRARIELQQGNQIEIPTIGKFIEENGKIRFETNEIFQFRPVPIAVTRIDKKKASQPITDYPSEQQSDQGVPSNRPAALVPAHAAEPTGNAINWFRVILALAIMLVLAASIVLGAHYYRRRHRSVYTPAAVGNIDTPPLPVKMSVEPPPPTTASPDSLHLYKFIIDSYFSEDHANKLAKKMQGWGHKVEVIKEDSIFLLTIPVMCKSSDTSMLIDSFTRTYNPAGVTVY